MKPLVALTAIAAMVGAPQSKHRAAKRKSIKAGRAKLKRNKAAKQSRKGNR